MADCVRVGLLIARVGPNAGETVGLQLHAALEPFALGLVSAGLGTLDLRQDAQEVLDVVVDLVRHDAGSGEVAGGAELALERGP